jgi:hypothetical protein
VAALLIDPAIAVVFAVEYDEVCAAQVARQFVLVVLRLKPVLRRVTRARDKKKS